MGRKTLRKRIPDAPTTVEAQCRDCGQPFARPVRGRPRLVCYDCKPRDRRAGNPEPITTGAMVARLAVGPPARNAAPKRTEVASEQPRSAPGASKVAHATAHGVIEDTADLDDAEVDGVITAMERQFPGPLGFTEPRVFTPPLRELTPETTLGYKFIDFCHNVLRESLVPWQCWLAIHALELAPGYTTASRDWLFRFKVVLVIIARQNGKSDFSRRLKLFKMYVLDAKTVIGTAQDLDIARMMLAKTHQMIQDCDALSEDLVSYITANGRESINLAGNRSYTIKASNKKAGRGPSADHVDLDELREHRDFGAWSALRPTIRAVRNGQIWGFSNAGDDESAVLNKLQATAVAHAEQANNAPDDEDSRQTFIAEWSAPKGCELDDIDAIRHANPALGYLFDINEIWSALENDPPNVYRTETLCQRVESLDGAFDADAWKAGLDHSGTLEHSRDRLAMGFDVALDGQHVSAYLAAEIQPGRYRIEAAGAWRDTKSARPALAAIVTRLHPRVIAWFKNGPAAAMGADLRALASESTEVRDLGGSEISETCQEFVDLVRVGSIVHAADPLLDAQVIGAGKRKMGDGFVFVRSGKAHVDAVYAVAGAVHGARTMPADIEPEEPLLIAAW